MSEWAAREVKIACKRENPNYIPGEWDYGCACYESALKAYKSLCDDEHSGFSFGVTAGILKRLLDSYPLTPITEDEDCWRNPFDYDKLSQQCQRMFSLFRDRQPDGSYKYHDVERVVCCDADDQSAPRWSDGFISSVIDEMFPITMPYYPVGKYYVFVRESLYDEANGDFDTIEIVRIKKPDGSIIEPGLYYKETDSGFVQIEKGEYDTRISKKLPNTDNRSDQNG
jgi:hypothetical protein